MFETTPPLSRIPTFSEAGHTHVVVETPKGSRNKYAYTDAFGAFQFKMVLPEGMSFPYGFGMIPSPRAPTATLSTSSSSWTRPPPPAVSWKHAWSL